jgi:hypothetical protein
MENKVKIIGTVSTTPKYELNGCEVSQGYFWVACKRKSNIIDNLAILCEERNENELVIPSVGDKIKIEGSINCIFKKAQDKSRLLIFIKPSSVTKVDIDEPDCNEIEICGVINKRITHRFTPKGREITDFSIWNTYERRFSTIPCIAWNYPAHIIASANPGTVIKILGRLQSREYIKKIDNTVMTKQALELSVIKFRLSPEEEKS